MNLKIKQLLIIILTTINLLLGNSLSLYNNGDGTWNVDYFSNKEIGGFQFNVDGASVVNASGGDATSSGLMISTSARIALGFSLTGDTIPPGEGTLVVLTLDGEATGLSGIIVSDGRGNELDFTMHKYRQTFLNASYPNPFFPTTTISYDLAKSDYVSIIIYDVMGRQVTTLFDGYQNAGVDHKITWDATSVSAGTYFVQMKAGNYSNTQTLKLVTPGQITSPQVQAQSAFNNLERKTAVNKKNEAEKPKYNSNPNYQENNNSYEPFAEGSVVFVDNFKSLGVEEFESEILRTELESALQQLGVWKITERGEVEKILREQKFQHSGCTDTECAVKIGQFLNADYIVTGQAGKLGSQYSLAIKLIDVESAEIKRSKTSQAKDLGEFLNKLPMIAKELTEK